MIWDHAAQLVYCDCGGFVSEVQGLDKSYSKGLACPVCHCVLTNSFHKVDEVGKFSSEGEQPHALSKKALSKITKAAIDRYEAQKAELEAARRPQLSDVKIEYITIDPPESKHKCWCPLTNLMTYGCRCGGV